MSITTYLANRLLDHQVGKAAYSMPTVYVGLSSTTPTPTGGNITEPTGGGYVRVATSAATWASATNSTTSTAVDITFPTAAGNWVSGANLTYGILYDAPTNGNVLGYGALTSPRAILSGDSLVIPSGSLTITLNPGGVFEDRFNQGALDTTRWTASGYGSPGGGSTNHTGVFDPTYVDFTTGMLRLRLSQAQNGTQFSSTGSEIVSKHVYGYGTYEFALRVSSTAATPTAAGTARSGAITSGFSYVNASETEINFEHQASDKNNISLLNWTSETVSTRSVAAVTTPDEVYHTYKYVWSPTSIAFYIDDALVDTHTTNIPTRPAKVVLNHWGTNNPSFGGAATPGVDRYVFATLFRFTPA